MKQNFMSRIFPLFLSICLLISNFSIPALAVAPDSLPEAPALSEPAPTEESAPEESVPETSIPEEAAPEESIPEEAAPEESIPEEAAPEESIPEEVLPEESLSPEPLLTVLPPEEPDPLGPGLYFGLLHAHTGLSDGIGTPAEAFAHAAQVEGLDFFALTDHSHSFDNHLSGQISADASGLSQDWAAGKAAAAEATSHEFVALFGYEMSWPANMQIGHIATFGTPGFHSWRQEAFSKYSTALSRYCQALATVPDSVSQFNHPGTQYGSFSDFTYSKEADAVVSLMELGSGGQDAWKYYIRALDQGWHLAPTNNQANHDDGWGDASSVRTVVYAQSLTEAGILDALRQCRAYATEDSDLEILYRMEGALMGSRLSLDQLGDTADITVTLSDPTDNTAGIVEVITSGGKTISTQTLNASGGTLAFSLEAKAGYYFLRVTQPDGDVAVTAPIWVEPAPQLGISSFTCETSVPVQHEAVVLNLTLYNRESADFLVDTLEIFADSNSVARPELAKIGAASRQSLPITLHLDCVGLTRLTVRLSGTLEGRPITCEAALELSFHQSRQVTSILVDGSHQNAGLDQLQRLKALALEKNIDLVVSSGQITADALENHRFLLVSAPAVPFSEEFLTAVAEYTRYGGSLVVCGQGDSLDGDIHSAAQLNRLLAAAGATMTLGDDVALDPVSSADHPDQLYPSSINRASQWCRDISTRQVFRAFSSATVEPGGGTWLVKASPTALCADGDGDGLPSNPLPEPVLLAWEPLPGGGNVFACGSLFCSDASLAEPDNLWDKPYANLILAQTLLGIGGDAIPLSTIAQARQGSKGELFRIRGYVTAGTSNVYNTFQDTLYLQDDTGAIAITPFPETGIQQGSAMEFTGYADSQNGNRILKPESWKVLPISHHHYPPARGAWPILLDAEANGSRLIQVEGQCLEIYCREDDTMVGCLLLDGTGGQAKIWIEDQIGNASDGLNELHLFTRKGRTIRATGLVYVDEYGDTVIRVRNCQEVVYVPPKILPALNPPTGDDPPSAFLTLAGPLAALLLLFRRKNKTSG